MRLTGRRSASRRLTVAEVRALNDAPLELTGRPESGVAYIVTSVTIRQLGAGHLPALNFGSNAETNALVSTIPGDFADDQDFQMMVIVGAGATIVGELGAPNVMAVADRPVLLAMQAGGDLSAADFELDVDVEILEVPIE